MKKILLIFFMSTSLNYSQPFDSLKTDHTYLIFDTHSKVEAFFRSFIIPGWGQFYNKQDLKGIIFLSSEVILLGTFIYFQNQYSNDYDKYSLETNPQRAPELFRVAEDSRKKRNLAAIV